MYKPRTVLLRVISRYLSDKEYQALIKGLAMKEIIRDKKFIEILKMHFDMERWKTAPLIKSDILLYNYFQFEYKYKLKLTGLLNKYVRSFFIFEDAEFFSKSEMLKQKEIKLPKGVSFVKNPDMPSSQNHLLSEKTAPKSISGNDTNS